MMAFVAFKSASRLAAPLAQSDNGDTSLAPVLLILLLGVTAVLAWLIVGRMRSTPKDRTIAEPVEAPPVQEFEPVAPIAEPVEAPPIQKARSTAPVVEPVEVSPVQEFESPAPITEPIETPPVQKVEYAAPIAEPAPAAPVVEAVREPDDLQVIEGIGPKISRALMDAGITTFAQLAETSVPQLEQILADAQVRIIRNAPATWAQQARLAAAGDWEELEALQSRLKGGRIAP